MRSPTIRYEPPPEARPATAPTQRTVDTDYMAGSGRLGSPGRLFAGHHALRGSHAETVAEGRGKHYGILNDPEEYLLAREIENVAMETELFTLDDRRCLSRNMKNHLIKMHRQHEKNVAEADGAVDQAPHPDCFHYKGYRKKLRNQMMARTTTRSPTPYTVRKCLKPNIVEHLETHVVALNERVAKATAKTDTYLSEGCQNARRRKRERLKAEIAGPVAHVMAKLAARERKGLDMGDRLLVTSAGDPLLNGGGHLPPRPRTAPASGRAPYERAQPLAPRTAKEALMLASERKELSKLLGADGVSATVSRPMKKKTIKRSEDSARLARERGLFC